jgi:hypothetical protein
MIKGLVTAVPSYQLGKEAAEAMNRTIDFATREDAALRDAAVRAVVPVTHVIRIEQ